MRIFPVVNLRIEHKPIFESWWQNIDEYHIVNQNFIFKFINVIVDQSDYSWADYL